jgi:hypothetical protein
MKARLRSWVNADARRFLRLDLDADWPAGWAIPYQELADRGLAPYFHTPPPEGEGLQAGIKYRLADGLTNAQALELIEELHQCIEEIRPTPAVAAAGLIIEDARDYG